MMEKARKEYREAKQREKEAWEKEVQLPHSNHTRIMPTLSTFDALVEVAALAAALAALAAP